MNRALLPLAMLAICLASHTPTVSAASDEPAQAETPWLTPTESPSFDELRIDPETRLDGFRAYYVETPTVAFRDNWQRDQNRHKNLKVKDRDVERIRNDMSDLFQEVVTEAFLDAGYALAEAPGEGVLVVRPAIEELDIIAPDVPTTSRTYTYSQSAGAMTLAVELVDGGTGRAVLQASERKRDPDRQFFEWRTRPNNTAVARRMMRTWAGNLESVVSEEHWLAATR